MLSMPLSPVLISPGGQRILVIIAHPDDAESFCGGTMFRLAGEGSNIQYLVITKGDKGSHDHQMTPARLSSIREEEQRQAASVLGIQKYGGGGLVSSVRLIPGNDTRCTPIIEQLGSARLMR